MRKKIALIPGDGIGKEIFVYIKQLLEILDLDIQYFEVGLDKYRKDGVAFDENLISKLKEIDAILFGAISTPPRGELTKRYKSPILTIRKELDLFVNVRPSSHYIKKELNNIVVFRENTEGLYSQRENVIDEETVIAEKVVTKVATEKLAKFAFDYALQNNIKTMTIVSKANVLRKSDGFFVEICKRVGKMYPDILIKEEYIDATCYHLVRDTSRFEGILTENLYGDIVSDLIAGLGDGLGMAISECYGNNIALFEPVHGSAPDIAGKDLASPYACLFCLVSLLNYIGEGNKKNILKKIITDAIEKKYLTQDLGGAYKMSEVMQYIIACSKEKLSEV